MEFAGTDFFYELVGNTVDSVTLESFEFTSLHSSLDLLLLFLLFLSPLLLHFLQSFEGLFDILLELYSLLDFFLSHFRSLFIHFLH